MLTASETMPLPMRAFAPMASSNRFESTLAVCASVCFVKQHSALDVLAALPLCLLAELVAYGKSWWLPRWKAIRSYTDI